MFIKNWETLNNNTMNTDKTLEWGFHTINHSKVNLNIANSNFNYFYRWLSTNYVRIVISDGIEFCSCLYCIPQNNSAYKLLTIIIDLPFKEYQKVSMGRVSRLFADHILIFSALYYLLASQWALYFAGWEVELLS